MRGISIMAALFGALACNGGEDVSGGAFQTTRPTGAPHHVPEDSSSGDATMVPAGATTGDASTGAEAVGTGTSTSTGGAPDLGTPGPAGCLGKLDFLFVIAGSWDMELFHQRLLAALPGILAALETSFPGFDTQFMVVDSNSYWSVDDCAYCQEDCNKNGPLPFCGAAIHPCDTAEGAGVTFPAGIGASNRRCELAGGRRYVITREEPDVLAALECVAQLGHGGGIAMTGDAMIAAVSAPMTGPGGCNEGFIRDDALLVVAVMQDHWDEFSVRPFDFWTNALIKAKHGDEDAVAMLALFADIDVPDGACAEFYGYDTWQKNPLRAFIELAPHGWLESLCVDDYAPFFADALAEFAAGCDRFIPR